MSGSSPNWSLQLTTPLGTDALTLMRIEGDEHVSQPFLFHLTMTASSQISAASLLGKPACVTLIDGDGNDRYIHGLITRFVQSGEDCSAELRPWLWMLSLFADNRIFQSQTVPDIITAVFSGAGFTAVSNKLKASYTALDYCVQFQETSLEFVCRLMEETGIFYFFTHTSSAHTLVLADDASCFTDCQNATSIPFLPLGQGSDWLSDLRISDVAAEAQVTVAAYKSDDYNFTTPATELKVTAGSGTPSYYEYPGRYTTVSAGETVASTRIAAFEAQATQIVGQSPVRQLTAGGAFTLTGHSASALNIRYAIRSVHHMAARREYVNRFIAFPATVTFRPPRVTRLPRIPGSQTAIVTGPSGKEIYTDSYGRVKVQFNWDQLGTKDENSSCWIRVSQSWAGVSWGAFTLPRVGQEVVVTFINGDPDQPLITGCVYNGTNTVPYPLPDQQTKTTLKSNSSTGGGGYNEIRMEDNKGSEELFIQAQKDLNVTVLNNETVTITQDRSVTLSKGNDSLTVSAGNRTSAITKGNETHSVGGTRGITVTGDETHTNKAKFTQTVTGDYSLSVSGNLTIKASGSITLQSGSGLTVTAGTALTASSGTSAGVSAGTALTLKGSTTAEITAGASGTINGGGSLALKGGVVQVN